MSSIPISFIYSVIRRILHYLYRVKVVNRAKKSEYVIKRLQYTGQFGSTDDLHAELQSYQCGYERYWLY